MNFNFNYEKFRALIFDLGYDSEKMFFEETRTPKSTFQNIKNGSCDLTTVKRLCGVLKCEITDLFPSERLLDYKNEQYVSRVKKIAVLSVTTGVGVTTFSVNLAQMLERRKYKTLIVEIGESSSFDILELHNKKSKTITIKIADSSLDVKRHGNWLDSLRLYNHSSSTSNELNSENGINFELTNLKMIFEELVKKNHYDYIVFSCKHFPFHTLIEKGIDDIHGQVQLVKLADIAIVGLDTKKVKIERAKLLIKWLCNLNIEIFISEFMRAKKDMFTYTRYQNNEKVAYFDKLLYRKYITDQKKYFKILHDVSSQDKNVHVLEQFLSYFGDISLENLGKSIFKTQDSLLKKAVRNYKYQVKNIFEEIDSFEREV